MKLKIKKNFPAVLLAFFIILIFNSVSRSQDIPIAEELCTHPLIKTIMLYKKGWELSMPIINYGERLEMRFDLLSEPETDFSYSVISCNYNWVLNEVNEHDYLEGFNDVALYDYESSRNTTKYYTHYSTAFPNDDLGFLQSGNYLLKVHDAADRDKIFFTRRFAICEDLVEMEVRVNRPDYIHQELMLEVNLKNLEVRNPVEDIKVVVLKNYDWENKIVIQKPPMLRDNVLFFDMPFQIITTGDNEYRYFDAKDVKYIAPHIDSILYIPPEYHYYLSPDRPRTYMPYLHSSDLNGRSYYDVVDAYDRHTEADYVNVHFTLESQPMGADVYIYGGLTDWKTNEDNYMVYDPELGVYQASLLIKQGMINYLYVTREYNKKELMFDLMEGSHDETENDYQVFVYWTDVMSDFDRLVGYTVVNSKD